MEKLSAAAFAEFLMERAEKKDGYIMGSTGQDPGKWARSSWWFTQYTGRQRTKALYWRENAERVFDCQGLAEGYINDMLGTNVNVYARTNYAQWCSPKGAGAIPVKYRLPGAAVFYHNGARVSHVGYLVRPVVEGKPESDWYVVEARGVMYGVVTTRLNSRSWNRWGLMTKYFSYGADAPAESAEDKLIIDISRWNGKIKDAHKLKQAVEFVIHRASCGLTKDAVFEYNARLMNENGVPFGVYHYIQALSLDDAREEARFFYSVAQSFAPKFWALDCEYGKITSIVRKKDAGFARDIVDAFMDELHVLGADMSRVGCYVGHHLYKLWDLDYKSFAFMWIPRYGKNDNIILERYFPAYKCDLHQYTSRGQCPGIADATIDLNRITGTGRTAKWFRGEED